MTFAATHVELTGDFILPISVERAFPRFSPEGERSWVPGWDPVYLHPGHPSMARGTVFRTTHGGEETLWLILAFDPARSEAEYLRVTPGSRVGMVRLRCRAEGKETTRVTVTYELTALSAGGNAVLADLTAEKYAGMLEEWRGMIARSENPSGVGGRE